MAKLDPTKPPNHLSATMRRWWSHIVSTYELESQHLRLLQLACEAWDVGAAAQKAIEKDGLTFVDRWGQPKPRPEVGIARDARIGFARLLRELGLDLNDADSRPPRIGGARY